jgi:16S rRNA (adenine1518-N6/adenine1519-N6)-dimethyltransferase
LDGLPESVPVLEIGAGLGDLTEVLAQGGRRVVAIERDRDLVPILRQRFDGQNITIVEANALTYELPDGPWAVVGNLPYHISSKLVFAFLGQRTRWQRLTIMLQKELAERAVAGGPGEPGWSRFSAQIARLCTVHWALDVPPEAFTPAPRVDSAVVCFTPRDRVEEVESAAFARCLTTVFGTRRKTLKNNLKPLFRGEEAELLACLRGLGIDPGCRGETLELAQLAALARALAPRRPTARR